MDEEVKNKPLRERRLYLNHEEGEFQGVFAGLADYLQIDVTIIRLIAVIFFLHNIGGVLILYVIASVIIPENPNVNEQQSDYDSYYEQEESTQYNNSYYRDEQDDITKEEEPYYEYDYEYEYEGNFEDYLEDEEDADYEEGDSKEGDSKEGDSKEGDSDELELEDELELDDILRDSEEK